MQTEDKEFISMSSLVSSFTFGQVIQSLQFFFFLLSWQYLPSFWQPLSSPKEWGFVNRVGGETYPFTESHGRYLVRGAAGDSLRRALLCRRMRFLHALFQIKTAFPISPFFSGAPCGTIAPHGTWCQLLMSAIPRKVQPTTRPKKFGSPILALKWRGMYAIPHSPAFLTLENSKPAPSTATTTLKDAMAAFSHEGKACGKPNTCMH